MDTESPREHVNTIPIASRLLGLLAIAGSAACASSPQAGDLCNLPIPPVAGWSSFDEGDFTLRLPSDYTRVQVQGIDSRVGRWEAPGKQVSYDLGPYANPLEPGGLNAFADLVVCQESDGSRTPRIIRYTPEGGGYAVAAHWPDLRESGGMTASLTLEGLVQQPEDQGEILAIIHSVAIAETESGVSGDGSGGSTGGANAAVRQEPSTDDPDRVGYRAAGNEPFWNVTFGATTMDFFRLGAQDTVRAPRPDPERRPSGWRFEATANQTPFVVEIEDRLCRDSMSGTPFPHTVSVTVGGMSYTGCGGETASLIAGTEWRVSSLEGAETSGRERPTLLFAGDGTLTGTGGCNRYSATYEITGEGIEIGPALATRMACIDAAANAQETSFFALLEQVTRFDIAGDGSLVLLAGDRPVITGRHPRDDR